MKIISGGQTGVDRGALDAALALGFECGGWCPSGRLAEDGIIPEKYPLKELESPNYRDRTLQNVIDSDSTVIFYFGKLEGGTELTLQYCETHKKPHLIIDADEIDEQQCAKLIQAFTLKHVIKVLNVAGPRGSKVERAYQYTRSTITRLLQMT